jgi:predicted DNA-binding transcriptional regulator AlpA
MQMIRISELRRKLGGISRATIRRIEKNDPTFPRRIQLAPNVVAWDEVTVDDWLANRPRGPLPAPSPKKGGLR